MSIYAQSKALSVSVVIYSSTFNWFVILGILRCADSEGDGQFSKKCILPFLDTAGITYSSCTLAGTSVVEWCSTLTDANNVHNSGNWGNCAPTDNTDCFTGKKVLETNFRKKISIF